MRKVIYPLLLLFLTFFFTSCLKNQRTSESSNSLKSALISEAKNWLQKNSTQLSSGKLSISISESITASGELSWDSADILQYNDYDIIRVPFAFKNHAFSKRSRLLSSPSNDDLPLMINLYFKKEKAGKISGALKITAFNYHPDKTQRKKYISIYNLALDHVGERMADSKGVYKVRVDELLPTVNPSYTTSSNCEQLSYTQSYAVSCVSGEVNNTICTYKKRTVIRYRCYADTGDGEQEEIDWIENDETGGGWEEYDEETEEYANQNIIDSLQGYPCAQTVLAAMPNLNAETKAIIQDVFNSNADINITFFADPSLRGTAIDGQKVKGSGAYIFNGTVAMNPDVLENATKEYILVTFLHESIHAYFKHQVDLFNAGQIDSNTFKQNFLIFWNPDNQGYLNNPTALAEHELMANKYLSLMENAIISFNPSISHEYARALAWGGLEGTRIYITKIGTDRKNQLLNLIGRNINYSVPAGEPIPQFFKYSNYNSQNCP